MNVLQYIAHCARRGMRPRTARSGFSGRGLLACGLLVLVGCGGGGGGGTAANAPTANAPPSTVAEKRVRVADVTDMPIAGAVVTVTVGGVAHQATTGADGSASFAGLPNSTWTLSVSANGFESITSETGSPLASMPSSVTLTAKGLWAIGQAIVLGTQMVERTSDGRAMTFSVDVAVIGENSEPLETLTNSDFSLVGIDCGWGGPRDCASDAEGNATPNFAPAGEAQAFELQPPAGRHPYVVAVLAERSAGLTDWEARGSALRSFFDNLGGNDVASLASVQTMNGSTTLTTLGPFTSDGSTYFDAIDQLALPAEGQPEILGSLVESIEDVASAEGFGIPDAERTVLVLAAQSTTVAAIDAATAAARAAGVRISTVTSWSYGLPEMAVRTGGFMVDVSDPRALGMVFGALDRVLAGSMSYYRMQFRLEGSAGTFVSGGNAKAQLRINVPASVPNHGVLTQVNVAVQ